MANFFTDNDDLQFLFEHLDLHDIANIQEDGFSGSSAPDSPYAPLDAADTVAIELTYCRRYWCSVLCCVSPYRDACFLCSDYDRLLIYGPYPRAG